MSEITNEKFGGKTLDGWQSFINTGLKKTVEATLDSASRIAAYKKAVAPEVFKSTLKQWYGFGDAHLSYWAKIDENMDRFKEHISILPAAPRSLYELAAIEQPVFKELVESGKIKPSLTVENIKELKASGGKLKTFLLKFSSSPDYLEICRKADALKAQDLTVDEVIHQLAKWVREELKIKPEAKLSPKQVHAPAPQLKIDDDDDDDDEVPNPQVVPKIELLPKKMTHAEAYASFGIYLDKPLDNLAVERALTAQAGDDDVLLQALEVILNG